MGGISVEVGGIEWLVVAESPLVTRGGRKRRGWAFFTKEVGGILVEVGASEWLVVAESPFVPSGGRKCR
ncbi:hypothetical protein Q75_15340, partial [Bacillus coahuilensis p1.1.43]